MNILPSNQWSFPFFVSTIKWICISRPKKLRYVRQNLEIGCLRQFMLLGFLLYCSAYQQIFFSLYNNHYQTRNLNWWQIKRWRSDLHSVWQIIRNMRDLKSLSTASESFWHSCHCCLFKAMIRNRIINFLHLYQT